MPRKRRRRSLVRLPSEYLEALDVADSVFQPLYELENGLRIAVSTFLADCYGAAWWDASLKQRLRGVWDYAAAQQDRRDAMPWIGNSNRITVLPIHLVTLGHLELIVKGYQSDCIPQLFPTIEFFLGHMEVIKRVRNLYAHMFPCITRDDCVLAKREIRTLATHINTRL